jgi:cytochrome P450
MKILIHAAQTLTDLPGPKGLPWLGNLLQIDMTQLHTILEQWAEIYGSVYRFNIATKPVVAIAEPELIQEVLRQRPETYRRLGTIAPVLAEMGINGVFGAEGEPWRKHRRMAMQTFSTQNLRHFFPTLTKITSRLKTRWEQAADTGQAIEVQKDLMCYAVDVMTNLTLGYDLNSLGNSGGALQQHLEKILPMVSRRMNAPVPYWRFVKLPIDRALDRSLTAIRLEIGELIEQSRIRLAQNLDLANHPTNFLEAMLATQASESGVFTDDEIVGNLLTMLLAGEDTVANTIAWMMYFMTEYPEAQRMMQQEADIVLGNSTTLQQIQEHERLSYINAVAQETMRLKPVGPMLFHETTEAVKLGGMNIPAGTALFLLTRAAWMQESAFANPTQFQPERWLSGADALEHNPNTFIPFGSGARFCPGQTLALLEIKAVIVMLCRNFAIAKSPTTQPVEEHFAFTMMPKNLLINFYRRTSS